MTIFTKIFRVSTKLAVAPTSGQNLSAFADRSRLENTMPGETGARIGARFGLMV